MGIISGLGSFRGQFGDHFRVGDHFGVGIISGADESFKTGRDSRNCSNFFFHELLKVYATVARDKMQ